MDNDELLGSIQDDFEQQEREYDEEPDLLLAQDKFSLKFNEIVSFILIWSFLF